MTDRFTAERIEYGRKGSWRVVRYVAAGDGTPQRIILSQHFRKQHTAERRAYELQVGLERHFRRPVYLGD